MLLKWSRQVIQKNILAWLGCLLIKKKIVVLLKRSRNFNVKWRENFSSNVRTERWTSSVELSVELNVERWTKRQNVYAKINLRLKTQGYGSTVDTQVFRNF